MICEEKGEGEGVDNLGVGVKTPITTIEVKKNGAF